MQSKEEKCKKNRRIYNIYTNDNIPLEEKRNLIQGVDTIYKYYQYEINRIKKIEANHDLDEEALIWPHL